jgi:hypothetical protein
MEAGMMTGFALDFHTMAGKCLRRFLSMVRDSPGMRQAMRA